MEVDGSTTKVAPLQQTKVCLSFFYFYVFNLLFFWSSPLILCICLCFLFSPWLPQRASSSRVVTQSEMALPFDSMLSQKSRRSGETSSSAGASSSSSDPSLGEKLAAMHGSKGEAQVPLFFLAVLSCLCLSVSLSLSQCTPLPRESPRCPAWSAS